MIESFSDFLKKSNSRNIFEGNYVSSSEGVYIPKNSVDTGGYLDKEFWKRFENIEVDAPKCVSDDKILTKSSRIVIKFLKKSFADDFYMHPYVVKIDGKDGSLICSENMFIALTRTGVEKKVYFFNTDPMENKTSPVFVVSTKKLGFLAMMDTLVFNLKNIEENLGRSITEAKERVPRAIPEIDTTPVKKSDLGIGKLVDVIMGPKTRGSRDADFAIDKSQMNDFLKLWELYSDGDIFAIMTEEEFDKDHIWYDIQQKLFFKVETATGKRVLNANNGRKVIGAIHNILCGVEKGYEQSQIDNMKECWFWGAGKSGKLATEVDDATGIVTVKECEEVLREEIDLLEDDMRMEEEFVSAMLNYVKEGGKNGTTEDLEGCMATHRGLMVTGIGGIGKTAAIKKAVEKTGTKNGIHYVKFGSVGTAQATYKQLYKFNNMVIIYDDTQSLWDDEDKINLFKRATSENEEDRTLDTNNSMALTKDSVGEYYDVKNNKYTRQEIYKKEIGTISNYEKKVWIEKKMEELQKNHKAAHEKDPDFKRLDDTETREVATKKFKEYEQSRRQALYPNQFVFNGFIVFITNKSLESFQNSRILKDHWGALSRRLSMIDLSPRPKVLWAWLKEKVWDDINNPDLTDSMRILPKVGRAENSSIENVMDFLEQVVSGEFNTSMKTYGKVTFSTFTNLRKYLNSKNNTERRWKELIKRDMLLTVGQREYT